MKNRYIAFMALAAALTLASCEKFPGNDRAGRPVEFSASSQSGLGTRTSYSGEVIGGRERIDWVSGDPVKIYMHTSDQALSVEDYSVVQITANNEKSQGKISALGEKLVWKEGVTHNFYSVYPASWGGYSNNTKSVSYWMEWDSPKFTFTLPAAQYGDIDTNMQYAYLAAVNQGNSSSDKGKVVLEYYPMTTTLYFTLKNTSTSAITISTASLSSPSNANPRIPLAGTYMATLSGGRFVPKIDSNNPWSGDVTKASSKITAALAKTLAPGESLSFAFFVLPRTLNANDLTLSLVTANGKSTISLSNSGISSFEACKKYNLNLNIDNEGKFSFTNLNMSMLLILSDSELAKNFEYLDWTNPKGLFYKKEYKPNPDYTNPYGGYLPVSDDDIAAAIAQVTKIDNSNNSDLNYLLNILTSEDFATFPNLTDINLTGLGNDESFTIDSLDNLLNSLAFSGNASNVTISNCNFVDGNGEPMFIRTTRDMQINISNVTGVNEIVLMAGDPSNPNGVIESVSITDCPDLKSIKILKGPNAEVRLPEAIFENLPKLETIYIEQANETKILSVSDCESLTRLILCQQTKSSLKNLMLSNCPELGDGKQDSSEFGWSGLHIELVSGWEIKATKENCPKLSDYFMTNQYNGDTSYSFKVNFNQ